MNSDRFNWLLTIAANVGVILGLVFLAVEIHQSSLATQASLHLELVSYGRDNAELLATDDRLADIVFRGEKDPNSLTPVELERFLIFTTFRLTIWETALLNRASGVVTDSYWVGFDAWYSELVKNKPGYKLWWERSRHGFVPGFASHVDQVLGTQ
jgi:hypothetical protein